MIFKFLSFEKIWTELITLQRYHIDEHMEGCMGDLSESWWFWRSWHCGLASMSPPPRQWVNCLIAIEFDLDLELCLDWVRSCIVNLAWRATGSASVLIFGLWFVGSRSKTLLALNFVGDWFKVLAGDQFCLDLKNRSTPMPVFFSRWIWLDLFEFGWIVCQCSWSCAWSRAWVFEVRV